MKFKYVDEKFPSEEERYVHYNKHVLSDKSSEKLPIRRNKDEITYEQNAYKLAIKQAKGTNPYDSSENILGFVRCDAKDTRLKYRKDMNEIVIYYLTKSDDVSFDTTITTTYFATVGPTRFQKFYNDAKEEWRSYLELMNPGEEITDIDIEKHMIIPNGI